MQNLIMNPMWVADASGDAPQYFTNEGEINFDNFRLKGYRTCTVCMASGRARNIYDPAVCVRGHCALCFGYCIRAIEAQSIRLGAEFSDLSGSVLTTKYADITSNVTYRFGVHMGLFPVPEQAQSAKLFIEFNGKVIACTFCAPRAFYYGGMRSSYVDSLRRDIFEPEPEPETGPRPGPLPEEPLPSPLPQEPIPETPAEQTPNSVLPSPQMPIPNPVPPSPQAPIPDSVLPSPQAPIPNPVPIPNPSTTE